MDSSPGAAAASVGMATAFTMHPVSMRSQDTEAMAVLNSFTTLKNLSEFLSTLITNGIALTSPMLGIKIEKVWTRKTRSNARYIV